MKKHQNPLIGISTADTFQHIDDALELLRFVDMSGKLGSVLSEGAEMGVNRVLDMVRGALRYEETRLGENKEKAA